MPGPFSTALANTQAALDRLNQIGSLPPQAQAVRQSIAQSLQPIFQSAPSFQAKAQGYVKGAVPELTAALKTLQDGGNPDSIKAQLIQIVGEFQVLQNDSVPLLNEAKGSRSTITQADASIAEIERLLEAQIAGLVGQKNAAEAERAAAKSRYWWLIALGPFGLAGLAVVIALIATWDKEIADIDNRINGLSGQIAPIKSMVAGCRDMTGMSGNLLTAVADLDNVIAAVSADCQEIMANLSNSQELQLFITATIGMLHSLATDAG